jgi:predicted transporter
MFKSCWIIAAVVAVHLIGTGIFLVKSKWRSSHKNVTLKQN